MRAPKYDVLGKGIGTHGCTSNFVENKGWWPSKVVQGAGLFNLEGPWLTCLFS